MNGNGLGERGFLPTDQKGRKIHSFRLKAGPRILWQIEGVVRPKVPGQGPSARPPQMRRIDLGLDGFSLPKSWKCQCWDRNGGVLGQLHDQAKFLGIGTFIGMNRRGTFEILGINKLLNVPFATCGGDDQVPVGKP